VIFSVDGIRENVRYILCNFILEWEGEKHVQIVVPVDRCVDGRRSVRDATRWYTKYTVAVARHDGNVVGENRVPPAAAAEN